MRGGGLACDIMNFFYVRKPRALVTVDKVRMSRQTTLFGRVLPSRKYYVYENPSDKYQKFIEANFYQHCRGVAINKENVL